MLIKMEYRGCSSEEQIIARFLGELYYVPAFLQQILGEKNCKIVFCKGPLTDTPELRHNSGKHFGREWRDLAGAYESKAAFLRVDPTYDVFLYPHQKRSLVVHEIAHGIDEIVGEVLGIPGYNSQGGVTTNLTDDPHWHHIFDGNPQYGSVTDCEQNKIRQEYFARKMEEYLLSRKLSEKISFWWTRPAVKSFFGAMMKKARQLVCASEVL